MKQILYASVSTHGDRSADIDSILAQSRHNNAIDGVTGLLWADGLRFLQVIEGEEDSVDLCFDRIKTDSRHHDIVVLADRLLEKREFGYWAMAYRRRQDASDEHDFRVRRMLENASPEIAAPFLGLVSA